MNTPVPEDNSYGPALMRYAEAKWTSKGLTRPQFGKLVPFGDPSFTRWSKGDMPTLPVIRHIANALDVSAVEVLHGMGVITTEEAAGLLPERPPASIDEAIETDPTLTEQSRQALRVVREATKAAEDVTTTQRKRKR